MIIRTWQEIDSNIIRNMFQKIFENLFTNEPRLLKFIGLEKFANDTNVQQWKQNSRFRTHVQVILSYLCYFLIHTDF